MGKVIAIANQKGGVGKTVTSVCLAQNRNRVLVVDFDPQGSLTKGLGFRSPDSYQQSIKDLLFSEINEKDIDFNDSIIHTDEHFDLLPSNISLSGADIQLSSVMSRETVFKRVLDRIKDNYDYILIDSNPALNLFTINGLVAADSIIIPVQAEPYATDGLNDLLHTINTAKKQINPYLKIDGILITMTDGRTNLSKHIANEVRENYGKFIRVFKTEIPRAVKTSEASLSGQSPIKYAPNAESSLAYRKLAREVEQIEQIHDFANHPFRVRHDEEMIKLIDSIQENGVLMPVLVRPDKDSDGYEMVSGHRRKFALQSIGITEVDAIVRDLDDDQATIIMVDSNIQRENILPSERGYAYRMKLEAMKHQGKRVDLTSSQLGTKLKRADDLLAEQVGESRNQIQRYIRITYLIKSLRDMVDGIHEDGFKIALNPAYELSFLTIKEQNELSDCIITTLSTPSLAQAQELKRESQNGSLCVDVMMDMLMSDKPNQKEKA